MSTYPIVAVAGLPGAALPHVASYLHSKGWLLTWPGQVLTADAAQLLRTRFQNYECLRLHQQLFMRHELTLLSTEFPVWYSHDSPSPLPYRNKFNRPFVVSDSIIAPVLDWWLGYVDVVVDVQVTEAIAADALLRAVDRLPAQMANDVAAAWKERYESNLKQFGRVVSLPQDQVLSGQFNVLDDFLKGVMGGQSK